jgi:hypothetical protein
MLALLDPDPQHCLVFAQSGSRTGLLLSKHLTNRIQYERSFNKLKKMYLKFVDFVANKFSKTYNPDFQIQTKTPSER